MSRHRDVRSMNYSEEYEGYDDVYGHSVEDDYCVSPGVEQFLFDRSKQQNIASFITEPDIVEDNEAGVEPTTPSKEEDIILTELEKAKLISCMESIKNILGDTVPDPEIKKKIIQSNFNAEVALDLLLKESSPKNVTGSLVINKDNAEHNPDAASVKPQFSSFIIPKLSFKKQNTIENINLNVPIVENLESMKNLTLDDSTTTFSSLSELMTNHVKSTSLKTMKEFQINSNTPPFKSLADLTAHHLQKSSSLINSTSSNEKTFLPNTNFVIPKLSIKKDRSNDLNNTQLDVSTIQKNTSVVSESVDDKKKDYSIDSFEKSISNVLAFSENYTNSKSNLYNLETKEDSLLNVSGTRTPSPDNWMIDLSSALKEATFVVSNKSNHTKTKVLKDTDIIPDTKSHTFNQNFEIPNVILPTKLNLRSLNSVKLPYTKRNVSLFARTLCRTWKLKRPILKSQEQQHQTVKRFDFSIPYIRNKQNPI